MGCAKHNHPSAVAILDVGSRADRKNVYRESFKCSEHGGCRAAIKHARTRLREESDRHDLTKNRHRTMSDGSIEVQLTQDKVAYISPASFDTMITNWTGGSWHAQKNGNNWYAVATYQGGVVQLHALITGNDMTDHRDRDGLNNRLENLRTTTPSNNCRNKRKRNDSTTEKTGIRRTASGYIVHWYERPGKQEVMCFSYREFGKEYARELAYIVRWSVEDRLGITND